MPRINLLPWRDTLRKEREQRFLIILSASLALTGLVFAGIHFTIAGWISYQESRNRFLTEEIKKAEAQIKEIETLEEKKVALIKRMEAIQELEETRPLVVHLFDELVRKVPDGVFFTSLKQVGPKITLAGVAQSDARVSSLMTNMEGSEWLTNPQIFLISKKEVENKNQKIKRSVSEFTLEFSQKLPKSSIPDTPPPPKPGPTPPKPPEKK